MDNILTCKICSQGFENDSSLHKHLKKHKIRISEYYHQYYPRYDKFSNELILFVDKERYFSTDFNSKDNLRKWFAQNSDEVCVDYIKSFFTKRMQDKKMVFVPTQVELKSLPCPSVSTINNYIKNYKKFCLDIGLLEKFPDKTVFKKNERPVILIDTREQKSLEFKTNYAITKLNYGDYRLNSSNFNPNLVIERKSFIDFISTFSEGFDRFLKEVERSQKDNATLLIVVEKSLFKCLDFRNLCEIPNKLKVTPAYIFHNVRHVLQNYKNTQFLFVKNHEEASILSECLLIKEDAHSDDIQLAYDQGKFNDILSR